MWTQTSLHDEASDLAMTLEKREGKEGVGVHVRYLAERFNEESVWHSAQRSTGLSTGHSTKKNDERLSRYAVDEHHSASRGGQVQQFGRFNNSACSTVQIRSSQLAINRDSVLVGRRRASSPAAPTAAASSGRERPREARQTFLCSAALSVATEYELAQAYWQRVWRSCLKTSGGHIAGECGAPALRHAAI